MRARIIPLLMTSLLLSSCNGETGAATDSNVQQVTDTSTKDKPAQQAALTKPVPKPTFTTVEMQRSGGIKCPVDGAAAEPASEDLLCATIKLSYPQVSFDANPEVADALNAIILRLLVENSERDEAVAVPSPEQFADSFIAEYKEDTNPFTSWELERSVNVAFSTDSLVTLSFEEYSYRGGAHPSSSQRYAVLSLKDGKPVELADLLSTGYETPLNVEGEKIFRKSRALVETETLEEQGFSFENNVFSLNDNFGVLKEGLDFIFNSYDIAPYAMGPTQFTIPYEDIQSLIITDGPLGHTIQ